MSRFYGSDVAMLIILVFQHAIAISLFVARQLSSVVLDCAAKYSCTFVISKLITFDYVGLLFFAPNRHEKLTCSWSQALAAAACFLIALIRDRNTSGVSFSSFSTPVAACFVHPKHFVEIDVSVRMRCFKVNTEE